MIYHIISMSSPCLSPTLTRYKNIPCVPEVVGVRRSDIELTIKSVLAFCIDRKHCDVYYANVHGKQITQSNLEIKSLHSVHRSVQEQSSNSEAGKRCLQNWGTPHLTFTCKSSKTKTYNYGLTTATELKQYLSDSGSPKAEHCSLHKGIYSSEPHKTTRR